MSDQVRINGNIYSWGSITVKVAGEIYYGFTSITYADKRERTAVYGMGKHQAPRAKTRGKYSVDPVKLKGPKDSFDALRAQLASLSASGVSFGDFEFQITVQYVEDDETPITDTLNRCSYVGTSGSFEEGADAMMEEVEIFCMSILWNGLTLFDSTGGAP